MANGKYKNTLEELRDTRNFAKLATVYRYLAKFRDGIAASSASAAGGVLEPILKHLDQTLKDYRDLASEITGYPVQDGDLRVNLGDEFGAAPTPGTGQHAAGVEASKIDVIRELAGAQPFSDTDLKAWDLISVVRSTGATALYGKATTGTLSLVTKRGMTSPEAEYTWDAMAELASHPVVQEARGCLNRFLIGVGVAVAAAVVVIAGLLLWPGGGDDGDEGATGNTPPTQLGNSEADGPFGGFSADTQKDLVYLSPSIAGLQTPSYTVDDEAGDAFNSFGDEVTFVDPLTELVGGYGGRLKLNADAGQALTCGAQTGTGMSVVCAEGVSGALPAGDYVVLVGSVRQTLTGWKASVEYKYTAFLEDRERPLAFPEGDPRFPNNTLIRTNSYMSLRSVGGDTWTLTTRWAEGQQFRPWAEAPATDNAEPYVRAALGGNTFLFVAPSELFSETTYYNVGTEAHPAGEPYTAQNTTQDALGANPRETKPQLWEALGLYKAADDQGLTVAALQERLNQYVEWVREGDAEGLSEHLDRSARLRWGEDQCTSYFSRVAPDDTFRAEVSGARGPVTWNWEIYGIRVGTLFDVYEFDVNLTQQGTSTLVTAHFAWDDATDDIRIFSPCVTSGEAAAEVAAAQAPPAPPIATPAATGADVAQIRSLIPAYETARRAGADAVFDYLHPIVVEYYGEDVCRDFYANQVAADPTFAFGAEVRVTGPAAYAYMPGGVTVGSADNVYSFVMDTTIGGQTQPFTWRFALVDGGLRVFQTCRR